MTFVFNVDRTNPNLLRQSRQTPRALAHAHTRQFQHDFISFLSENYTTDVSLGPLAAAQ